MPPHLHQLLTLIAPALNAMALLTMESEESSLFSNASPACGICWRQRCKSFGPPRSFSAGSSPYQWGGARNVNGHTSVHFFVFMPCFF